MLNILELFTIKHWIKPGNEFLCFADDVVYLKFPLVYKRLYILSPDLGQFFYDVRAVIDSWQARDHGIASRFTEYC